MSLFRKNKKLKKKSPSREYSFSWQIIKGILKLLIVVAVLVCVYYTTRFEFFTIETVAVEGGETISHDTVRTAVENELKGTYFRLIPKQFIYLYPHERIREVLEEMPRIHNIHITREQRTSLLISFDEYLPHALLCLRDDSDKSCYFMDETGYTFAESPNLQGGTFVRHLVTAQRFQIGEIFERQTLSNIEDFIQQSKEALGFRINAVEHMSDMDVSFLINGGGLIIASLRKDLSETLENIAIVLESDEFSHIEPGNFKYIDARFDNKIFINENFATSTATSTGSLSE